MYYRINHGYSCPHDRDPNYEHDFGPKCEPRFCQAETAITLLESCRESIQENISTSSNWNRDEYLVKEIDEFLKWSQNDVSSSNKVS